MIPYTLRRTRLLMLANRLENLPKELQFDFRSWAYHSGVHPPEDDNYCGTKACVLGHAALMPEFRAAGLRLQWEPVEGETDMLSGWHAVIHYGQQVSDIAGAAFFGLTHSEARGLFLGDGPYGNDHSDNIEGRIEMLRILAAKSLNQLQEETGGTIPVFAS